MCISRAGGGAHTVIQVPPRRIKQELLLPLTAERSALGTRFAPHGQRLGGHDGWGLGGGRWEVGGGRWGGGKLGSWVIIISTSWLLDCHMSCHMSHVTYIHTYTSLCYYIYPAPTLAAESSRAALACQSFASLVFMLISSNAHFFLEPFTSSAMAVTMLKRPRVPCRKTRHCKPVKIKTP